jgi:hypothetical protein
MGRFNKQNEWRKLRIDALFAAVADDDANAIEKAISVLLIPADSAFDFGFRASDYSWYADLYQSRIDGWDRDDGTRRYGLHETLIHKTNVIGHINERRSRAYGDALKSMTAKRDDLYDDIMSIRARIDVYQKLILILRDLASKYETKVPKKQGYVDIQALPKACPKVTKGPQMSKKRANKLSQQQRYAENHAA